MNRRIRLAFAALAGMLAALLFTGGASTEPAPQHARPGSSAPTVSHARPGEPPATGFKEGRLAMAGNPPDSNWMSTGVQQRATPAATPSRTPRPPGGPGTPTRTVAPARTATPARTTAPTKAPSTASTPTALPVPEQAQNVPATATTITIVIPLVEAHTAPTPVYVGILPTTGGQSESRDLAGATALALTLACLLLGLGLAFRLASTCRTR